MNKKLIEALKAYGFKQDETGESLFFTCLLQLEDKRNVIKSMLPDHFKPSYDYRSLFLANVTGVLEAWDIMQHRIYEDSYEYDSGNIFASGKTLTECVKNFLDVYRKLEYNRY